jgi:hypothetical protein
MAIRNAGRLLLAAALLTGCSAIKANYKGQFANEVGREGWWKTEATPTLIEAVRRSERVVITAGPRAGEFMIKIDPRQLSMPVPPSVISVVEVNKTGINGEARVYKVPEGESWDQIRDWYLKWFDFKPTK